MSLRGRETKIAEGLASSDEAERTRAVGAFVRLFTCSAPTELALQALCFAEVCASYRGGRPLAQYLLESLPLSEELSLAWRIALLEGSGLSAALQEFEQLHGAQLRKLLRAYSRQPEDVCQDILLRLLTNRRFRRTFFGKYSGKGSLLSYLRTTFVREAIRRTPLQEKTRNPTGPLDEQRQTTEGSPDAHSIRQELRASLTEVFQRLARDPGLLPFLLQQGFAGGSGAPGPACTHMTHVPSVWTIVRRAETAVARSLLVPTEDSVCPAIAGLTSLVNEPICG